MEKLSVIQLKNRLKERGASTRGRKADLLKRLEDYIRNDNFEAEPTFLPPEKIADWPEKGYKQLCTDHKNIIPPIQVEHVHHYFKYRQVLQELAGDIKSIQKGQELLEAKRVDACSFVMKDQNFYGTGIVRAAMKKKLSYNFKIKIDSKGEIENSHCECPAGKGPHGSCKHIAAVGLMLAHFVDTGEIQTSISCTATLQVFHHPVKKYSGSPVKAESLEVPSKVHTCLDDPRPENFRNVPGFQDRVRSLLTNFCYDKNKDISLRYTWDMADLDTAVLDHDYLHLPYTEYWVDRANEVNQKSRKEIEEATREQVQSKRWHVERKWRLTASNFGTIVSLTSRRNIDKLLKCLHSPLPYKSKPLLHGLQYEGIARKQLANLLHKEVKSCGLFVSLQYPYLAATPDGLVEDKIVEIKCPFSSRNEKIDANKHFPFLHKSNGNLYINQQHHYYAQIQGQMFISDKLECLFVVYTFKDLKVITVPYDEEYCKNSLIPKLSCFYIKYYRPYIAKSIKL